MTEKKTLKETLAVNLEPHMTAMVWIQCSGCGIQKPRVEQGGLEEEIRYGGLNHEIVVILPYDWSIMLTKLTIVSSEINGIYCPKCVSDKHL